MATQNISLPAHDFTGMASTSASNKESLVASNWQRLLIDAVSKPGRISQAYTAFHNYSIGNALEALWQCTARGIDPGPLNTFMGWKELGRHVRKGERAISLWMPITCKTKVQDAEDREEQSHVFTRFIYKPHWFVLSQTEGTEFDLSTAVPGFDSDRALSVLKISRIPFDITNGNCQGYATAKCIAISPIAVLPHKTFFHETAHVVLGHTAETGMVDDDRTPRDIREAEAEAVALICCESLGLEGAEFSRGYIQHWLRGNPMPEKSAQKIFSASRILKAGQQCPSDRGVERTVSCA
jgi:antirestriction protein ArdC